MTKSSHSVTYQESATRAGERIRESVRAHYAAAITAVGERSCCSGAEPSQLTAACPEPFGAAQYADEFRQGIDPSLVQASFGCGNPLLVADLHPGDTVLDLGSGGGLDVLLSARRVGPTGMAYGLDMTDEMLAAARRNAEEHGAENVEFLKGDIESIPLPDASVDVVISNCVINLSADKAAVFAEVFRVLRPGGRLGVTDVVWDDDVTAEVKANVDDWAGCAAGAISRSEYVGGLANVGFEAIELRFTHEASDAPRAALIRAVKPAG